MLSEGSRSKGTIARLIASWGLGARWVLVAVFTAVLVLSSPLPISSSRFLAAHSSRKAPRLSITKVKAVSEVAERWSSSRRAAHKLVTNRPSHLSVPSLSHDAPQPIFRPLRC
jgi:hypothetical protein